MTPSQVGSGSHVVTATYSGEVDFAAGSGGHLINVQKDRSTTHLSASTTQATFHKSLTLTANVFAAAPGAGMPTGTVTFKEGAKVLGKAKLVKGVAKLTLTTLGRGKHTIAAVYSQDADFLASSSALVTVVVA